LTTHIYPNENFPSLTSFRQCRVLNKINFPIKWSFWIILQKYSCIFKTGNRNKIYIKTLITDYISRYYIKYERIWSDCFLVNNLFFIEDFKPNLSVAPASFTLSWRTDFLVLDYGVHYFYMFQSFSYVKREKNLKLWLFDTFQSLEIQ
jgi:hypothetical protein